MDTQLVDVHGNTYPHRHELRALGATWNRTRKVWQIDAAHAEEAHRLVNQHVRRERVPYSRSGTPYFYSPTTGATVWRNPRGLCEDAPCCGCCTG